MDDFKTLQNLLNELDERSTTLNEDEFSIFFDKRFKCIMISPWLVRQDDFYLYRMRSIKSLSPKEDLSSIIPFSYIPKSKTRQDFPPRGRMNKTGQAMFYASINPRTNLKEIYPSTQNGDYFFSSKWKISKNKSLRLFPAISLESKYCPKKLTNILKENAELQEYINHLSALIKRNENNGNSKYLCSSQICKYILERDGEIEYNGKSLDIKYDGIAYPSIQDKYGINIVLKPEIVDKQLELVYVILGKATDEKSISFDKIGFNTNGKIIWYEFRVNSNNVNISIIAIESQDKTKYKFDNNIVVKDKNNKIVSLDKLSMHFNAIQYKLAFAENTVKKHLLNIERNVDNINNLNDIKKSIELIAFNELENWKIETNGRILEASKIWFEVRITNSLVEIPASDIMSSSRESI